MITLSLLRLHYSLQRFYISQLDVNLFGIGLYLYPQRKVILIVMAIVPKIAINISTLRLLPQSYRTVAIASSLHPSLSISSLYCLSSVLPLSWYRILYLRFYCRPSPCPKKIDYIKSPPSPQLSSPSLAHPHSTAACDRPADRRLRNIHHLTSSL